MPDIVVVLTGVVVALTLAVIALSVAVVMLWRRTRHAVLGLDELAEDTLKALYHLSREKPVVRASDLARAADLQPDRLPMILGELKRRGWAHAEKDTWRIAPPGEKRALELIRAHRLWERYLSEKEGLALDALHDEATRREPHHAGRSRPAGRTARAPQVRPAR
jgi:Mn-dependent DtxR family transcriptional regulator